MRSMRAASLTVLAALAVLAACGDGPVEAPDASWLTATVQGAEAASYQGDGHFIRLPDSRRPGAPQLFLLASAGVGDARSQGFELTRSGGHLPEVGRYALGPGVEFAATYTVEREGRGHRYRAGSGEVNITHSSADRVEGSFRFRGSLAMICTVTPTGGSCTPASEVNAASVEVSGVFRAVPQRPHR